MNEQALKARLRAIAQAENRSFNEVLKKLILERFLYRLLSSSFHQKFIFKGGLLLSYYLPIGRETLDIDFLAQGIHAQKESIKLAFEEICSINSLDGFIFTLDNIEILEHNHMSYAGLRISLCASFQNIRDIIKVDIGVGDVVAPSEKSIMFSHYKGHPLFEGSITLQVYPIETIFSEKLETIVSRGAANSRMKDYHDILLICRNERLVEVASLKKNIAHTFAHRKTEQKFPVDFSANQYERLESLWAAHRRSLSEMSDTLALPMNIKAVIAEVNAWLEAHGIV